MWLLDKNQLLSSRFRLQALKQARVINQVRLNWLNPNTDCNLTAGRQMSWALSPATCDANPHHHTLRNASGDGKDH